MYTQRYFPERLDSSHTLSEAIERYLREVLPYKRPNTIIGQTQRLYWWQDRLGAYKLTEITPDKIHSCLDTLEPKYSAYTVNAYLSSLSRLLAVAVKNWNCLSLNSTIKVHRLPQPRGKTRFLSDEERAKLLAECKASKCPVLYTIVVLSLSTGCRKMEMLSLTWDDIDLSRRLIHICESKNGKPRTLPVTGLALELLQAMQSTNRDALVFPAPRGNKTHDIKMSWMCALKRAGIKNFRFHDLRHTTASYLAMGGTSLIDIAQILGHRDLSTTMRYAYLSQQHTRSILERMTSTL